MKIIVDRDDDTRALNITQKMWDNGMSLEKYNSGITIRFFNEKGEESGGTFIYTTGIRNSEISSFVTDIENHILEDRRVIVTNQKIIIKNEL